MQQTSRRHMPEDLKFTDARTHISRKSGLVFAVSVPTICCNISICYWILNKKQQMYLMKRYARTQWSLLNTTI